MIRTPKSTRRSIIMVSTESILSYWTVTAVICFPLTYFQVDLDQIKSNIIVYW